MKGSGAKRNVCRGSCVSTGAKFPVAPVESAPMETRGGGQMTGHGGHSLGACLGSRVPGAGGRSIQTTSGISQPTEP